MRNGYFSCLLLHFQFENLFKKEDNKKYIFKIINKVEYCGSTNYLCWKNTSTKSLKLNITSSSFPVIFS